MNTPKTIFRMAAFAATLAKFAFGGEAEWKPLFNGHDLTGWETFLAKPDPSWDVPGLKRDASGKYPGPIGKNSDPLKVFTVEQNDGTPVIHVSGQGFGVMTTTESFGNFHLRLQVKWGGKKWGYKINAPRDCGLLYFVHGEQGFDHGTWPRSIEFQIQEHDMGDLFAIGTQITVNARQEKNLKGGTVYRYNREGTPMLFVQKPPVGNRCARLEDFEKPNGEWNTLDLICFNGDSIHIVNGRVEMRLSHAECLDGPAPAPLSAGQISLQTEGAEVFYRNIEIQPISAIPPEYVDK